MARLLDPGDGTTSPKGAPISEKGIFQEGSRGVSESLLLLPPLLLTASVRVADRLSDRELVNGPFG